MTRSTGLRKQLKKSAMAMAPLSAAIAAGDVELTRKIVRELNQANKMADEKELRPLSQMYGFLRGENTFVRDKRDRQF